MIVKSELLNKAEYLNKLAAKGLPLPDNLSQPEQLYYLSLRQVYYDYNHKVIDLTSAKSEKRKLVNAYVSMAYDYDLYEWHVKHERTFQRYAMEIKDSGCNVCQRLERVLIGLEE